MKYEEINPKKSLLNYISLFWQIENPTSDARQYTVLPDGLFDLIIIIADYKIQNITLYGICTQEIDVIIPANATVIGIALKPVMAEFIFKKSIANILNSQKELDLTFWNIYQMDFNNFEGFVQQFSNAFPNEIKIDNRKIDVFTLLFDSLGSITVEEISKKVFWGSRQINRYFTDKFGLSLKTYANILRCSAAYTDIRKGKLSPSVSYYDQSHFIKEVKKYTGSNPKELHQNENDRFLQFSPLFNL